MINPDTRKALKTVEHASPDYITILSRTFYAVQKQRIEAGNRIAMNVRDARLSEDEAALLNAHLNDELKEIEKSIEKDVASALKSIPIYKEWFKKVKGIGPILSGGMIGEIADISRFEHMSNLWSWAGYGIHNGTADRLTTGQKANWNPNMKVLGWKSGQSFVKVGGYFRQQYDQFKREEQAKNTGWIVELNSKDMIGFKVWTEEGDGANITKDNVKSIIKSVDDDHLHISRSDGHVNSRATRRAIKLFLGLTWMKWREIEGLPVSAPYAGGMMGHEIITPDEVLDAEERLRLIAKNTRKAKAKPNEA
jgi:hypothetical protein